MNLFEAKRKHRSLYRMEFKDGRDKLHIVFRALLWSEFKVYRDLMSAYNLLEQSAYEDIFKQCVLDTSMPHDIDEDGLLVFEDVGGMSAGIIDTVGKQIYHLSGAGDVQQLWNDLGERRDYAPMDIEKRMLSAVCAITKYKLEDFDNLYWDEILDIITQSELHMIGNVPQAPFMPYVEEKVNVIDFEKENRDDGESNSSLPTDMIEQRKQQTRERKKQLNIR